MEKIAITQFTLNELLIGCVGGERSINDLNNFAELRGEENLETNIMDLMDRIIFDDVYCYLAPETLKGKMIYKRYAYVLSRKNRLITFDQFYQGVMLVNIEKQIANGKIETVKSWKLPQLKEAEKKDSHFWDKMRDELLVEVEMLREDSYWKDKFITG